ncbi:MAG: exopolyphosphatase [Planctomycetes bacterium]|nr:exopolyphosphatase [Planctomycetota bacterium]
MSEKYRLVTRSDMDGLVAAVLLRELDKIDDIKFVHPKDVQDGKAGIGPRDITTNLPYVPEAHLAFDHHTSEVDRLKGSMAQPASNFIADPFSPSAARVVYNYFGGKMRFPEIDEAMLVAVDKADSAKFAMEEVLKPTGWTLLNFIMDPRTGLGRFKNFRVSNYNLMMDLIAYCKNHTIDQILKLPDVKERADIYFEHQEKHREMLRTRSEVHGRLVVLDLREQESIYCGNRFVIYAIFPDCNISMHVMWGLQKQNTVFAVGKSIFNRSNFLDVGGLMLKYGGGGHEAAGTCQIPNEQAGTIKQELIARISAAS